MHIYDSHANIFFSILGRCGKVFGNSPKCYTVANSRNFQFLLSYKI